MNEPVALAQLDHWIEDHRDLFSSPQLILLDGEMGAGKTTLVSHVVNFLGGQKSQVSSPTFALHHFYSTPQLNVDHMDLYRLKTEDDLESSGFFEVVRSEKNLCFIEWARRIDSSFFKDLRKPVYSIEMAKGDDVELRNIEVKRLGLKS